MPSILKIALPALVAASSAYAATCSISATTTIQNSGDATALASACSTFSGNIAIATGTTDDIALDGMQQLSGDLIVKNVTGMKRLSASDLDTVQGKLDFEGVIRLAGVDFPKLKNVDTILWSALPNLNELGFTAGIEKAKTIDIQNTGLRSLSGINVQQADTIFIANNAYINDISLPLANISKALTLADNNEQVKVDLSSLVSASNLTFRFCASVALPALQTLNGSLSLYNNGFDTFSAPNLTIAGQAIAIVANNKLSNLTFPSLTKVTDDLVIANNSALLEVDGFPELTSIGGAFDISGNMSIVQTPKMNNVAGAFNLQSTDNVTAACAFYQGLRDKKYIRGAYFCKGKVVDPGTKGHVPSSQGGKSNAGSTLSATNGAFALAAMAAVMLF